MNIQKMMKQAQAMQERIGKMQAELEASEFEGTAGNGAVKVIMTGKKETRHVKIAPSVVDPNDIETLEDLIVVALNNAATKIDDQFNAQMGSLTAGLGLPPGLKLPF